MREHLLRAQKPLLLVSSVMTVPLMMGTVWMEGDPLRWYLLPALYLILAELCLLPKKRLRLVCGLLSAAAIVAAGILLLPWRSHWVLLLEPVGFAALLLFFLRMGGWTTDAELPPHVPVAGLAAYILLALYTSIQPARWEAVRGHLTGCFLLFLLLMMLYLERMSLQRAMVDGVSRAPVSVRRRGLAMVIGAFLLVLLISLIPVIGEVLIGIWDAIKRAVAWLVEVLTPKGGETAVSSLGEGQMDLSGLIDEVPEENAFMKALEVILQYVTLIIVAVLAVVLLIWLGKKLIRLMKRLLERFLRYSEAVQADQEDIAVDTREDGERHSFRRRASRRRRRIDLAGLTPREKIRAVYKGLLEQHEDWNGATARQTLPEDAAHIYEEARYSEHMIGEDDAGAFLDRTKGM